MMQCASLDNVRHWKHQLSCEHELKPKWNSWFQTDIWLFTSDKPWLFAIDCTRLNMNEMSYYQWLERFCSISRLQITPAFLKNKAIHLNRSSNQNKENQTKKITKPKIKAKWQQQQKKNQRNKTKPWKTTKRNSHPTNNWLDCLQE